jgi:molecular chaperone GrpE (heat shock protein)
MEAGSFGGPDKNQVYGLSNTMAENLQMALSILTIGSSQLILSTQSQEFVALQEHTTHLTEKYKRISADYEELRQMIMDMRSQMSGTCVPLFLAL